MSEIFDPRVPKFLTAMELRKMMDAAGVIGNPTAENLWRGTLSPLGNGEFARRAQNQLVHFLTPRVIAKECFNNGGKIVPDVPKEQAIILCYERNTNREIVINQNTLTGHTLILGVTGAGKTSLIALLITQLLARGIRVRFIDHKGEGRRFLSLSDKAIVFRPEREFINFLEPVGIPEIFWAGLFAELGKARNLHIESSSELTEIMKRIAAGLKPGELYPSADDFVKILLSISEKERRPKLRTAAFAIKSLISILGRTAAIRRAPEWESRYQLIIYEYGNVPVRDRQFLSAIWMLRMQMQAMASGHLQNLREVVISDEAIYEFGHEFNTGAGSNYISVHKRLITQSRSFGIGVIAGAQIPSEIDTSLKANATTIACLRLADTKDARDAQQLLLLPEGDVQKILTLSLGEIFVRSAGFQHGVYGWYPKIELGPYLSDNQVEARIAQEIAWLEQNTIYSPQKPEAQCPISYMEVLGERTQPDTTPSNTEEPLPSSFFAEHRAFVRCVCLHPRASVTEIYRELKWGVGKANRIKNELLASGLIRLQRELSPNGGRPKESVILTQKGEQLANETN